MITIIVIIISVLNNPKRLEKVVVIQFLVVGSTRCIAGGIDEGKEGMDKTE